MTNPLIEMQRLGQSPWHDNIRRGLLVSGELERRIADGDITGLTSNPTIFEQAISQSSDYDQALAALARAGKNAGQIFDALAIDDIRNAAGLFRGVFDRTGGADGHVSIEVDPRLANDADKTVAEATRLWQTVDVPNLLVKIPATKLGLQAIERCIARGISINVTLIFSLERYRAVIQAYQSGIRTRFKSGADISQIASVASFFVSRVDTAIDPILDRRIAQGGQRQALEGLKGKAAIANAKLAYQMFREEFATPSWLELQGAGARRQRPLWASTSTKNPAYPDVYYVEALVGPDSVDTMPPATMDAYKDHGKPQVRITEGVDEARAVLIRLGELNIDMAAVTQKLEDDGVVSFAKSFQTLLAAVEQRRLDTLA
jgi:transaldolase